MYAYRHRGDSDAKLKQVTVGPCYRPVSLEVGQHKMLKPQIARFPAANLRV